MAQYSRKIAVGVNRHRKLTPNRRPILTPHWQKNIPPQGDVIAYSAGASFGCRFR